MSVHGKSHFVGKTEAHVAERVIEQLHRLRLFQGIHADNHLRKYLKEFCGLIQTLPVETADHLRQRAQFFERLAFHGSLGCECDGKFSPRFQPRILFENRQNRFAARPDGNSGTQDDDIMRLEHLPDRRCRTGERIHVDSSARIHGCPHADDENIAFMFMEFRTQYQKFVRVLLEQLLQPFLIKVGNPFLQGVDRFLVHIHADHTDAELIERERQRQSHVSQSDDGNRFDFHFTQPPEFERRHHVDHLSLLIRRDDVMELTGGNRLVAQSIMETRQDHIRFRRMGNGERITLHDGLNRFVQSVSLQDGLANISVRGNAEQPVILRDERNPGGGGRVVTRSIGDRAHRVADRGVRGNADGNKAFFHRANTREKGWSSCPIFRRESTYFHTFPLRQYPAARSF